MQLFVVQLLTGLASASSLFLVASGLSLIFGVTRIVNFAHGAFYMLGAYIAYTLTERLSRAARLLGRHGRGRDRGRRCSALSFEMLLLRRIYRAPNCSSFSRPSARRWSSRTSSLLIWGPEDLLAPRAPGLAGAVEVVGKRVPSYDLFLIVLGPLVLALLWLLLHRTRWGVLVRAATQDRDMVAALGVNQKWLFTGVFALGALARRPRRRAAGAARRGQPHDGPARHRRDLRRGGDRRPRLDRRAPSSRRSSFRSLNAFGILVLPKISLVLVFLVMALVLVVRPWGLFGRREGAARAPAPRRNAWRPLDRNGRVAALRAGRRSPALAAARARPLWPGGRIRNRDLRPVRREPASPRLGRRPRLVRPCGLSRPRLPTARRWR